MKEESVCIPGYVVKYSESKEFETVIITTCREEADKCFDRLKGNPTEKDENMMEPSIAGAELVLAEMVLKIRKAKEGEVVQIIHGNIHYRIDEIHSVKIIKSVFLNKS